MLDADDDLTALLQDHHDTEFEVSAFYGDTPTVPGPDYPDLPFVPLDSAQGDISFSGDADVQGSGTLYLADSGNSLVPKTMTDPLAPYGQELVVNYRAISGAGLSWVIPLGRYRITGVPDMAEYFARYPSQRVQDGWSAQLDVQDRFDIIVNDKFLATTGPTPGNTVWQEIQALSPIPILQVGDDAAIPAGITYQDRMDAITQLLASVGMVPHMTRQGVLTGRPDNNWLTATVPVFHLNGVISMSDGMSIDVINSVSVTCPDNDKILGLAEITDEANPLNVNGPLGRRTYNLSDPLMNTQAKADKAAATSLARLSTGQSRTVDVTCLPNPLIELGDYGQATDTTTGRVVTGEVTDMKFSLNPTASMTFTMTAAEVR